MMILLLSSALQVSQSASRFGISHTQTSVARLSTILKQRVSQSANRGSNTESALTSAFLEILLAATSELRKGTGNRAKNESFAFSRVSCLVCFRLHEGSRPR